MANKKVTLDVAVKADDKAVDGLEKKLKSAKQRANELKQQKIQMKIDADTSKLNETNAKIDSLKNELNGLVSKAYTLNVPVDTSKVNELQAQIEELDGKAISLEANIEKGKVDALQEQLENMNGKTVTVNTATDSSGLDGIGNKLVGIAGTLGMVDQATQMWEASTARQSQQFYLSANLGVNEAQRMQKEIQTIVSQVPGDDTFMNQLMTTALAQNTSLTTDELRKLASVSADYMAGSKMMGKMTLEAQQDIYKYILDGNTAELERGSILSSQVDRLKDQATIQDRIKAVNEAMQEMGYAGISGYDTASNNLEEFQGRLEKARADWGDVFLPLEQSAIKFAIALDDQYGGALGMAIVGTEALIPTVISGVTAFGEFHRGIQALKETRLGDWASTVKDKITGIGTSIKNINFSSKFGAIKQGLIDLASNAKKTANAMGTTLKNAIVAVANSAKEAVIWLARTSKELLISAGNALKSAGAWLWDNAVKLASATASKLATVAQWALNLAMSANPIMIVVIAIIALIGVLWYLYNTNEGVRNAIDGFGQTLFNIGEIIHGYFINALEWLQGAWQNTIDFFTNGSNSIGESVTGTFQWLSDSFNNVVNTFNTYAPLVAQILFVMATGGIGAIVLLIANMNGMPNQVGAILQNVINRVIQFASNFVNNLGKSALNGYNAFKNGISGLKNALADELREMVNRAMSFAGEMGQMLYNLGVNLVRQFLSGIGRNSPGIIQTEFISELFETGSRVKSEASPFIERNVNKMAENIVSAWDNPTLTFGFESEEITGNIGQNSIEGFLQQIINLLGNGNNSQGDLTFNLYGDMDKEERMQEFLEYVRKYLEWQNDTAGRTV